MISGMVRVAVLLSEGFTDSGLAVMLDVLNTANVLVPGAFAVDVVSAEGGPLRAASGLTISPTRSARVASRADVVMVSGIWVEEPRALDAVLARPETRTLLAAIRRAHARGATIGAACAGVSLLAAAGVLDGARATTTWWLASHFRRRFPEVDLDPSACLVAH
jgi:transcriptional regulator GlxA family with amidase domain